MPRSKVRKNRNVTHLPSGEGTGKPAVGLKTYGGKSHSHGRPGYGVKNPASKKLTTEQKIQRFAALPHLATRRDRPGYLRRQAERWQYLVDKGLTPSFNA